MTALSPILHCYRELELLAEQMLELARAGNWTAMTEVQQVYIMQVEQLRHMDHGAPISDRERMDRYRRLERILGYDAAIRNLLSPEMSRLGALLGNARRQQDLHQAYGSVAV
ncbi:flagellar protein FliT [Cupriavidus sp. CuC1]|uniref:flagellar protein FliT n=1 Tax=Cupriavidus sp. CuC1 TaxID=3373131 RepID=UPI0037CF1ACE